MHLIIDNAWCETDETRELLTELAGYQCILIGLDCPLDVLQQREGLRADRAPGLAAWEFERVHTLMHYDLRFVSGVLSARQMAETIVQALAADNMVGGGAATTLEALLPS
ncbi:Chloramphenicol phosphotransferase-like protein [Amantichitinum ursilacus]|uniref:Chloramphenicol phosphotransferase-like protein n=1 Tax=Amantichitinum ursilacus TaxID=857265 RepID=A0A0N1JSG7_9NEIS|nr:Chloramphenicol phosphotransferase-like protein [Amantichitinum ursilacus]